MPLDKTKAIQILDGLRKYEPLTDAGREAITMAIQALSSIPRQLATEEEVADIIYDKMGEATFSADIPVKDIAKALIGKIPRQMATREEILSFFKRKGYPSRSSDDGWYEWITDELLKFLGHIPKIEGEQKTVCKVYPEYKCCHQVATSPASEPIEDEHIKELRRKVDICQICHKPFLRIGVELCKAHDEEELKRACVCGTSNANCPVHGKSIL